MARWLPLESNPDVVNKYLAALGVPKEFKCVDVLGLEPDLLQMVPKPTLALFLLFPLTDKATACMEEEAKKLKAGGHKTPDGVFFMTQHIGNACGTIAIIHALANNESQIKFDEKGVFRAFLKEAKKAGEGERSKLLESNAAMTKVHESLAEEGQTAPPPRDQKIDLHFVALCPHNGTLYELDGRKPFPIPHGKTGPESFLADSAKVCQEFIKREPENLQFTVMALVKE